MEPNEQTIVVSDAGPIIHLDELRCLDLLGGFNSILIPTIVWAEIEKHRPRLTQANIRNLQIVPVIRTASPRLLALSDTLALDEGERASLAVVESYSNAIFLTDDAAARLAAESLRIHVHGTLGIIIRAERVGLRTYDQVLGILKSIPHQSTLYLSGPLLNNVISRFELR